MTRTTSPAARARPLGSGSPATPADSDRPRLRGALAQAGPPLLSASLVLAVLIAAPGADTATSIAVLRTLTAAATAMAKDPAAAREAVIAQADRAVQPAFVHGHYASYDYAVTLDKPLLQLLLDEGAWAKSAQKLTGTPDRATFLDHIDRTPLTKGAPAAVTLK